MQKILVVYFINLRCQ